jgi:hypothetical protein
MPRMDVSPQDISRVIRLVQEVCDRWDEPRVWREYLLHGACALLDGHRGTILANSAGEKGHFGRLAPVAVVGISEPMRQQLQNFTAQWENRPFAEAGAADPGFKVVYEEFARQRWVTVSRAEIADKLAAAASPAYRELRGPM